MTSRGHPHAEFKRALERGNLWVAEAAARDLPEVPLEDALKLVHLYAERESPKFEAAATKWLRRISMRARRNYPTSRRSSRVSPSGSPSRRGLTRFTRQVAWNCGNVLATTGDER